jgi:large subunit ribosomal protein L18
MKKNKLKTIQRERRKRGIRKRTLGTPQRPRLTVFRSSRHIYAQIIDDLKGHTLVSASTVEKDAKAEHGGNCDAAKLIGKAVAERAKDKGITAVTFDRNGFRYHGRVKAIADAAREGGLKF